MYVCKQIFSIIYICVWENEKCYGMLLHNNRKMAYVKKNYNESDLQPLFNLKLPFNNLLSKFNLMTIQLQNLLFNSPSSSPSPKTQIVNLFSITLLFLFKCKVLSLFTEFCCRDLEILFSYIWIMEFLQTCH